MILEMGIFEFLSFRIRGVVFWCVLCSDFECLELFDGDCSALLFFFGYRFWGLKFWVFVVFSCWNFGLQIFGCFGVFWLVFLDVLSFGISHVVMVFGIAIVIR